jgi:protein-tyrosine phosphatase
MGHLDPQKIAICFVCMGNICRSPTAEGVFRHKVQAAGCAERFVIDSAGTIGFHEGKPPDPRTLQAALRRGVDLSTLRSRKVSREDFYRFDYLLAMDHDNLLYLQTARPEGASAQVQLFLDALNEGALEVPDPYYSGEEGFETVLTLVERGAEALLKQFLSREVPM